MAGLVDKYHTQIKDGGAEDYLLNRGINRRAIERFKLGFTGPDGVAPDGRYKNRLTIPYLTPAGVFCIKYRCIADHDCKPLGHGKYVYDDGTGLYLFNAQTLLKADQVVITEGELDAISVEMAGVPAVSYPGSQAWTQNRFWRFCFDSCSDVLVIGDGDDPAKNPRNKDKTPDDPKWVPWGVGEEAAKAVAESLRSALPDVDIRMHLMPLGYDANRFIQEHGQLEFLEQTGLI